MKKFVIVTDSCSDLRKELREQYDIDYIPMHMSYDGKELFADLDFNEISYEDFFEMMRNGTRFTTAQITTSEYKERFEKYISEGCDILSISCSSALSASVKASRLAGLTTIPAVIRDFTDEQMMQIALLENFQQ